MKKVGTQVELDLTNTLKLLDKVFVALKKQSKAWEDWLGVVRKALPTLDDVESMLDKVVGRLNQLKFTEEGATETGRQEMEVRRRQIAVLRAVRDEYKKQTRATGEAGRAQERHTKSIGRSIKKMALWAVGAASAYRMFMKVRRAVEEFVQEVMKGTPELEQMTAASLQLRAGLAAAFGDEILGGVRSLTDVFTEAEDAVEHYTTQAEANAAVVRAAGGGYDLLAFYIGTLIHPIEDVVEIMGLEVDYFDELTKAQEKYNASAKEFIDKTEEATEKQEGFGDAIDAMRKRIEDYNKALYQVTERGLTDTLDAWRDYGEDVVELELDRQRQVEDDAIAAARRLEDIQRDFARRMAALERDYRKQLERARRDYGKSLRRAAEGLAQKLLDIERRYQDKLLDIERAYAYSMYDAIASRDATAALQAMRRRRDDLADAKRDRDRARADAFRDYARRIRDLEESLAEQERLARESYQEQLEELRRSLAEQEEDYQISLRRREEDAQLSYARSMEDLKKAFLDRLVAIRAQNELERANARADYLLRESAYARHLARMAAIYQAYQATQAATTTGTPAPTVSPFSGPPPFLEFAKGGVMIVNQPTVAMFGEAGRELVIAQPLPPTSQTHNITGDVTHQINATISQSIAGMEGRIAGAVQQALADVIH